MNLSLLLQQFVGYVATGVVTYLTTRYHLTADQGGIITTDILGAVGLLGTTAFGLWTHHRALVSAPPPTH
jgi:hypothetical protein